jgi:hypothetical protein
MILCPPRKNARYDHEIGKGEYLLALSETCRYMRAQTLPWIFREGHNWSAWAAAFDLRCSGLSVSAVIPDMKL